MSRGDRRARTLVAHPVWAEIELRLRHGQSPESVKAELSQEFPDRSLPSARTLRRFVAQQQKSWFVSKDLSVKLAAKHLTDLTDADTAKVLEERRVLIDQVKARIDRAMRNEDRMGADLPILIPEVRSNQALLGVLLRDQASDQAKLMAKGKAMHGGNGTDPNTPERADAAAMQAAAAILAMPSDQLMLVLEAMYPAPAGTDILGPGRPPICEPPCPHGRAIETTAERVEDPPA